MYLWHSFIILGFIFGATEFFWMATFTITAPVFGIACVLSAHSFLLLLLPYLSISKLAGIKSKEDRDRSKSHVLLYFLCAFFMYTFDLKNGMNDQTSNGIVAYISIFPILLVWATLSVLWRLDNFAIPARQLFEKKFDGKHTTTSTVDNFPDLSVKTNSIIKRKRGGGRNGSNIEGGKENNITSIIPC